jgi:hypothetical protein
LKWIKVRLLREKAILTIFWGKLVEIKIEVGEDSLDRAKYYIRAV